MDKKTVTTTPRKVVRWHEGYVIFLTKECKELGWDTKTIVRAHIEKEKDKERIIIEKAGRM